MAIAKLFALNAKAKTIKQYKAKTNYMATL